MKRDYLEPTIELSLFNEDVILASVEGDDPYGDDKDWGEGVL